jgi:hypothetical protein
MTDEFSGNFLISPKRGWTAAAVDETRGRLATIADDLEDLAELVENGIKVEC